MKPKSKPAPSRFTKTELRAIDRAFIFGKEKPAPLPKARVLHHGLPEWGAAWPRPNEMTHSSGAFIPTRTVKEARDLARWANLSEKDKIVGMSEAFWRGCRLSTLQRLHAVLAMIRRGGR